MIEMTAEDFACVGSAARQLRSRYRDFAEYDDILQELWLWMYGNYEHVERWRAEFSEAHARNTLMRSLKNAGERYCRKEKAAICGYSVDDEFFYTVPMVANLLALHFDPTWSAPRGQAYDTDRTSGGSAPQESGNLVAMIADVSRAYDQASAEDRALLKEVYGGEYPVQTVVESKAAEWDCTIQAAQKRINRAVGRLRAFLGGPTPYRKDVA